MKKMLRAVLPGYQGWAPVLVGLLFSFGIIVCLYRHLHSTQFFPDLVAGYVAYWGVDKSQDARDLIALVALLIAMPVMVASILRLVVPEGYRSSKGRAVNQLLLFSLIPAAWRLAVDCAQPIDVLPQFKIVCLFPAIALVALLLLCKFRPSLTPQHILTVGGAIILSIFLSIFVGFSFGVFLVRVIPPTHHFLEGKGATLAWICAIVSVSVIVWHQFYSSTVDQFQTAVLRWLGWLQYPLVLFFYHLVPPPMIDPQNKFNLPYPLGLILFLTACVLICWYFIWRRLHTSPTATLTPIHHHPLARAIAPASLAALLIYVYCLTAPLPEMNVDDFHWGEQALPWQQLVDFHKIPYVEFVPIHGFMSYLRGIFSAVFFDGTAASYASADILLKGLATAALAFTACRLVTPLGALFLLGGTLPVSDRMYFYIPALLAIAAPHFRFNPVRLLVTWVLVACCMFAYNPTQGPAFTVGSLPVAIWAAWIAFRSNRRGLVTLIVCVVAALAICYCIPIVRQVGFAFVKFVTDNGYTNNVAHGIPWENGRFSRDTLWGPGSTQFLWEMTRYFWFFFAFVCAALFWKYSAASRSNSIRSARQGRNYSLLILTAATPLYLLLWIPWIMGRINPGGLAYSGDVSHTCMYWMLPILVLLTVNFKRLAPALLMLAMLLGFFYPTNPTEIDPDNMRKKCMIVRPVTRDIQVVDGNAMGMPRLGRVLNTSKLDYIKPIKSFLDGFLKPDETYLDFTNRTAMYYYMNRPFPVRYVDFVDANSRMQAGAIQMLDKNPVPAVLLAPAIMIDMISPTLRDYYLYRKFATTYSMVCGREYGFLVDPQRGKKLNPPAIPVDSPDFAPAVDSYNYFMEDQHELPASWGRSWSTLKNLFTPVVTLDPAQMSFTHDLTVVNKRTFIPTGDHPYVEYPLPPEAASGKQADFLRLGFTYDPVYVKGPPPVLRVFFISRSVGQYSRPFVLNASNGELVIPMGAYPRWLLANDLETIRFDLITPALARTFRFTKIEFMHLNDPK